MMYMYSMISLQQFTYQYGGGVCVGLLTIAHNLLLLVRPHDEPLLRRTRK